MTIEVLDAGMKALVDPAAQIEKLAGGFRFTEGPVWDRARRCLYFSDIPADSIYRYSDAAGAEVYRKPSRNSNGLTLDSQGRLLACEHQARRVTREGAQGVEIVAERYQGKRLNSPNDIVVARDGSLIFTDPNYGLMDGLGGPNNKELPFQGVYRLPPGAAEPVLLASDFQAPNGLALTRDERRLYVDDTVGSHLRAFDIGDDWSVSGGRVVFEFPTDEEPGVPDGLKLDLNDNVYCTGPGGVWVIAPSGAALGRIHMPEVTANLNWGEDDAGALYLTASTGLYRLRCLARGFVRP